MDNTEEAFKSGEVDPVSGNEVPVGSMPEEVRDDVDAKLSQGEYVVPADIVRFYGVNFFEKLRKKAKEGLEEMDEEGRIGGEPSEEAEGEDELPFSDEELMSEEGEELEMAEGGSVPTFDPNQYQAGFSFGMAPNPNSGVVTKTYRNAAGEVRSIMFVNGQPVQAIPAGFSEVSADQKPALTTPQQPATTEVSNVTKQGNDRSEPAYGQKDDSEARLSISETGAPQYGIGKAGSIAAGGILGGLVGGLPGAAMGAKTGMQAGDFNAARNALSEALYSGETDQQKIKDLSKQVEDSFTKMSNAGRVSTKTIGFDPQDVIRNINEAVTLAKQAPKEGPSEADLQAASPTGMDWDASKQAYTPSKQDNDRERSEKQVSGPTRTGRAAEAPKARPDRTSMKKGGLVTKRTKAQPTKSKSLVTRKK